MCKRGKRASEQFPGGFYYDGARGGMARQKQDVVHTRSIYKRERVRVFVYIYVIFNIMD